MSFSKYLLCAMLQVRGGCIDSGRGYQKKIAFLSLDMKTGDSSSFLTPLGIIYTLSQASQVALVVKNLLPLQETQETRVQSLGLGDLLQEGMATHFSILAWRIPRTEEPGGLQFIGLQRVSLD